MKRRLMALLLTAILALMSACGQPNQAAKGTDNNQTAADTGKNKESFIGEVYSEEGTGVSNEGEEYDYSYHIPKIEDDTPAAAGTNEYIKTIYGGMAELGVERAKNGEMPDYTYIDYESHLNGTVLSLIIHTIPYDGHKEEYDVYNYDVEKGEQLINEDLLAMQGVTEEEFLGAVKRAAAERYDDTFFPTDSEPPLDYIYFLGDLNERRSATLSTNNITTYLYTYLNDDGALEVIVPIGSFGREEWISQPMTLDLQRTGSSLHAGYSDFLTASLKDDELSIKFTDNGNMSSLGIEVEPPYGEDIPVHGCYSDYTDMFFSHVSKASPWPTLFLLTSAGHVEYVTIETGVSGGYYCVNGPLPKVNNLASLEEGTDESGEDVVYAVLENGERVDLSALLQIESIGMSDKFMAGWASYVTYYTDGGGSYEEFYSVELSGCENARMSSSIFDGEIVSFYTGDFFYVGMTEDGLVYLYQLWDEETGELRCGTAALSVLSTWSEYGPQRTLLLKELSGDGLIYTNPGETTKFVESFG